MKHSHNVSAQPKQDRPKWRDVLPVHPAADLFPMMSEAELRDLGEDIKANGLKLPIILWSPEARGRTRSQPYLLLDGRNRLAAMELVGLDTIDDGSLYLDPRVEAAVDAVGDNCIKRIYGHVDPYAYVLSANISRRHPTAEQKRELIAKVLKAKPEQSNLQIAKQTKADGKTVAKVRTKLEATSEIPKLKKTKGKDGKLRPARKKQVAGKIARSLNGSAPPSGIGTTAPKPNSFAVSAKALAEFKYACDHWLPKMVPEHQSAAIKLVADLGVAMAAQHPEGE